jgi:diguanylate cyclase (GGDEF)-like protein
LDLPGIRPAMPAMNNEVQQQLLGALNANPTGFALFDPDERLRYANAWFRQAFSLAPDAGPSWEQLMRDCHRRCCGVLIKTHDIDAWIARVRLSYRRTPVRSFESDLVDGRWVWVTETLRPDGWLALTATDVSSLKANEATLRKSRDDAVIASLTDPLTDLYNRRYIFKRLHELLDTTHDMRTPLCLVVIDLDNFKAINDRHGHHTGDRVLSAFARHLGQGLRPLDAAGRIGGEEFMMVMPNTTLVGGLATLQRLRDTLAKQTAPAAEGALPDYTFSAGVALAKVHDTVESLFGRADQALYQAKASGRNNTVIDGLSALDESGAQPLIQSDPPHFGNLAKR